ncbi:DUF4395 domain-containing protein [Enterovibrio sp. ZSDZ35]|uniref:DUF4395 domain-containing protein n=1 Tax=Enterovibrio qingdaonensis TaxID=2899818 RepID=A0ABT5QKA5_9GAMM|nr:DUF4395 domain-containing protein [Enterovibrio sp. ZSDZ35]MDD1781098.1 DUF4395 domain-containing protein [Enterovibrio sp. ZSDZ35]
MPDQGTKQTPTFFTSPMLAMGSAVSGESGLRINETATRARAGLLNIISALTMFTLYVSPEIDPILYIAPYVIFDMTMAATFGLTPLSPSGLLGTALTMKSSPVWKPIQPKRFAWSLGALMGIACLVFRLMELPDIWLFSVLGACFMLTWLEAVLGFCVGCWMYNKLFGCEPCQPA